MCQQRSLGECRSGRWGYYSLAEGGGWASAPRQHMRGQGRQRLQPVADEAGRGYTCGTSRGAGATYARSRAPAQPAPRSTCTASPYTPRPAGTERREKAWALVAGGQQGRCRGVGWGRWDGLIGYGIPTAGRLCAAPISGCGSLAGTSWPCSLNAQGLKGMQQ